MSNATLNEYLTALLEDLDPRSDDYAAITEAIRAQSSLLVAEWSGIKRILTKDDEVAVSLGTKFVQAGKRIKGQVKIAYAEKFSDEAEFITPDNDQRNLFGDDARVTIKTGDVEHTMSANAFSQAATLIKAGKTIHAADAKEAADLIIKDAARVFGKGGEV
jgi:hypothetical protein